MSDSEQSDNSDNDEDNQNNDADLDDEEFFLQALKQIEEQTKNEAIGTAVNKTGDDNQELKITTDGIFQYEIPNVNFSKVTNVKQCHWCLVYNLYDVIINSNGENVCKHCYFCVNYGGSEKERFDFDTKCCEDKGEGIATFILQCYEQHDTKKCVRKPGCFLCDYKEGNVIKGIVNPDMLGICDTKNKTKKSNENEYNVDSADYIEMHENVMFCGGMDSKVKFKIPKKIVL